MFRCHTRRKKRGEYYSAVTGNASMARNESMGSLTMVTNLGGQARNTGMKAVPNQSIRAY